LLDQPFWPSRLQLIEDRLIQSKRPPDFMSGGRSVWRPIVCARQEPPSASAVDA
jgi:hypothetical protein